MIFHENRLLADDSHVTPYLIFLKLEKVSQLLLSAAVVIGALRVKSRRHKLFFVFQVTYPRQLVFTTETLITPDTFPFPKCCGAECIGTFV